MTTADGWPVLIIDDEQDIRDVTALTLMDAGYRVETAADGAEGLARCEQFSPRIVITDIRMPGMDGIQVLETIKQRFPDTEVIVATAFGEMEIAIRALQLDASDFITKPIHTEAMMVALERARHRYATRQQLKDYTRHLEKGLSRTTRQLEETVAFQDRLIESSMDGILGCDGSGKVVTFNRGMEQMLGFDRAEVLNRATLERFFSQAEYRRFQEDLAASGHGGPNRLMLYETCLLDHRQQPVPVQLSATVLMDEDESAGRVCFFRDLRRIHRLEQEMTDQARLLHQDKMMSLGRLAASVAHEINNPLCRYSQLHPPDAAHRQKRSPAPGQACAVRRLPGAGGNRDRPLLENRIQPAHLFPSLTGIGRSGVDQRDIGSQHRAGPAPPRTGQGQPGHPHRGRSARHQR